MRPILYLLILLLFCNGCNQPNLNTSSEISEKERCADYILRQAAIKIKKETNLQPFGTNGQMLDQIKTLGLAFQYRESIDIEKGRELLVIAIDDLVKTVNTNQVVRPYLNNYPFLPENIRIEIYVQNPDGREPEPGNLTMICAKKGILEYDIREPESPFHLETIYKETYEEAVQKLKLRKPSEF